MSCLMLLPVVLLVFGTAGSLVVLWKRNMEIGVRDANTSHVTSPASTVRRCFTSGQHTIAGTVRVRQQSLRWRFVPFIKGQRCQTVFNLASP